MGYWPKIMDKIHILDLNMDLFFEKEQLQRYLDAHLYNTILSSQKKVAESKRKAQVKLF